VTCTEAMTAHNIESTVWERLAKTARLPRDSWSDAWLLIHKHPADVVPLTEETILTYMRAVRAAQGPTVVREN
jgi:hypothetical protein